MNRNLIFDLNCIKVTGLDNVEWVTSLVRNELPFIIKQADILKINTTTTSSEDFLKGLLQFGDCKDKKYKISVSLDSTFSGSANELSQIEMSLEDYFDYQGQLTLYLSQINLLDLHKKNNLKNLINFSQLEKISNYDFTRVNIWHSYKHTLSKFHYDSYDNFLYVIKGKKNLLICPNSSKFIQPSKLGENTGNQCDRIKYKRSNDKIKALKERLYILMNEFNEVNTFNENVVNNYREFLKELNKYFILQFELNEGEVLYIPEGWWHQVETIGDDNLALNFWWEKTNKMIEGNKELFLIKQSMSSLVEKKIKKLHKKNKRKFKTYRIKYLRKLVEKNKQKEILDLILSDSEDDNVIGMAVLYEDLELGKKCDAEFLEHLWSIFRENDCEHLFIEKVNEMKQKISHIILDELKKSF